MSRRLKVLISAYACEPNKGSEPEVGWQWALQMARFHDVTVLTRSNNRPAIEKELELLRGKIPLPQFLYHEQEPMFLLMKARFRAVKSYYVLWQKSARAVVAQLHKENPFDLLHHVTFAGYRYPTVIWNHGVPCVWGPIGGIESIPMRLLPWSHPNSLLHESVRNIHNSIQSIASNVFARRAQQSTTVLASTREMQKTLAHLGAEAKLVPTIGLHLEGSRPTRKERSPGPLRLLFVGNILTLKGVDLALHALKQSNTDATFTLVGDGDFLPAARRLVEKLGLELRVEFRGRVPRAEVLKIYSGYDLFLFPSLHDTGGYAVIEAMSAGLPVICLDCGGPAVAVQENCGRRIPIGSRANVIKDLATAISDYHQNRKLISEHGNEARNAVLEKYDWNKKGEQMNEIYQQTVASAKKPRQARNFFSTAWKLFSIKQFLLSSSILLMVGALGFLSVSQLKKKAELIVTKSLPRLSYAGAANANLSQAFNRTLLLLTTEDRDKIAEFERDIESFSDVTTTCLEGYKKSIDSEFDKRNFDRLLQKREKYIQIRNEVVALVNQNKKQEATSKCEKSLLPAYLDYKDAGDVLLDYNMQEGRSRGEAIMNVCTVTQLFVATFLVGVFVVGFMIGLFR